MNAIIVQKINSEHGDGTPDGTFGKAVIHMEVPEEIRKLYGIMYGVVWDTTPMFLVNTIDKKLDIIDSKPVNYKFDSKVEMMACHQVELFPMCKYFSNEALQS